MGVKTFDMTLLILRDAKKTITETSVSRILLYIIYPYSTNCVQHNMWLFLIIHTVIITAKSLPALRQPTLGLLLSVT